MNGNRHHDEIGPVAGRADQGGVADGDDVRLLVDGRADAPAGAVKAGRIGGGGCEQPVEDFRIDGGLRIIPIHRCGVAVLLVRGSGLRVFPYRHLRAGPFPVRLPVLRCFRTLPLGRSPSSFDADCL